VQVNHLTAGRVPGGALVQAGLQTVLPRGGTLTLSLRDADFATARRLADAINLDMGDGVARPIDAGTVSLLVPARFEGAVPELMARVEQLPVDVDAPARVVVNERTGTVVVGANVRLGLAAVAHGNLSVRISTRYDVSQPAPFSQGETQIVPQERVDVDEADARLVALPEGATLDAVVKALNALGATPRDIIAIVQALRTAGALRAELVII
jgi:flagellar P-ring protein precursor FlgI